MDGSKEKSKLVAELVELTSEGLDENEIQKLIDEYSDMGIHNLKVRIAYVKRKAKA